MNNYTFYWYQAVRAVPQMVRISFLPMTNQMIRAILMTSLGIVVGMNTDLAGVTQEQNVKTFRTFEFFALAAIIYHPVAKTVSPGARLLTCINGLDTIDKGRILIDGSEVHAKTTDLNLLRRKIGSVFQQWNAFPHLTVLEHVTLAPRKVLGMDRGPKPRRSRSGT